MLKLYLLILIFFVVKINPVFSQAQQSNIQAFLHQPDNYVILTSGGVKYKAIQIIRNKNQYKNI